MIIAKLIDWQPIASLPEDRKDGRIMLLWADDQAVTARWNAEIVEYGVPGRRAELGIPGFSPGRRMIQKRSPAPPIGLTSTRRLRTTRGTSA